MHNSQKIMHFYALLWILETFRFIKFFIPPEFMNRI